MGTIINFPLEKRINQILSESCAVDLNVSLLVMHIDIINNLLEDETTFIGAKELLVDYCTSINIDHHDFDLLDNFGTWRVVLSYR